MSPVASVRAPQKSPPDLSFGHSRTRGPELCIPSDCLQQSHKKVPVGWKHSWHAHERVFIAFAPVDAIIREKKKIGHLILLFRVGCFSPGRSRSGVGVGVVVDILWSESESELESLKTRRVRSPVSSQQAMVPPHLPTNNATQGGRVPSQKRSNDLRRTIFHYYPRPASLKARLQLTMVMPYTMQSKRLAIKDRG